MKTAAALALVAVLLASCTTSDDTAKRDDVSGAGVVPREPALAADGLSATDGTVEEGTVRVTAPGTSPISSDKQVAFCQDQVAFMYSAEPQFVTARERVVAADGSTTIDVTVDKGNEGVTTFKCRLDASSRFIDVIAASEGVL